MAEIDVPTFYARQLLDIKKYIRMLYEMKDCAQWDLMHSMRVAGTKSVEVDGVKFRLVPGKITGSPSQRRQWRARNPVGALDAFHQPDELVITYPRYTRKVAA